MPSLVIRLDRSLQDVDLNWGPEGIRDVRLVGYHLEPLLPLGPFQPPLFFTVENQNKEEIIGNVGERFPLLFSGNYSHAGLPDRGLPVSSRGSVWGNSKILRFRVSNFDRSLASFQALTLVFDYLPAVNWTQQADSLKLNLMQG